MVSCEVYRLGVGHHYGDKTEGHVGFDVELPATVRLGQKIVDVTTSQALHDLLVRLDRGEEAVPVVSPDRSFRLPTDQVEELVTLYRSPTGAPGSAPVRRSRSSADPSPNRPPELGGGAGQAAE